MKKNCLNCNKNFKSDRLTSRYCSKSCFSQTRKTSISVSCQYCSQFFDVWPARIKDGKGKFCSKICYSISKRTSGLSKNNPNWKGGTTQGRRLAIGTLDYKNWRKSVFNRDDYTCTKCSQRGGILNADHIKPWSLYPKLRYDINNGRTLCLECHRETDTYGFKLYAAKGRLLPSRIPSAWTQN